MTAACTTLGSLREAIPCRAMHRGLSPSNASMFVTQGHFSLLLKRVFRTQMPAVNQKSIIPSYTSAIQFRAYIHTTSSCMRLCLWLKVNTSVHLDPWPADTQTEAQVFFFYWTRLLIQLSESTALIIIVDEGYEVNATIYGQASKSKLVREGRGGGRISALLLCMKLDARELRRRVPCSVNRVH